MNLAHLIGAAETANERALAARIAAPRPELDEKVRGLLAPYVRWCKETGVRWCPASPAVISAFIHSRAPTEKISAMLFAIEELHDQVGAPNPVQTAAVRSAILAVLGKKYDLPKDLCAAVRWTKDEKELLGKLGTDLQEIVCRRELNRNAALRRFMSDAGTYRDNSNQKETGNHESSLTQDT
jgi:hypothetical protein